MVNYSFRPGVSRRMMAAGGLAVLIGIGGIGAAYARQTAMAMSVYEGAKAQASGLKLGSWGSGSVSEDERSVYKGTESLRVVTHGQFQGAVLRLDNPMNLSNYVANKSAYLQFAVLIQAPASGTNGPGFGPGGPSGPGGFGFGQSSGPGGLPSSNGGGGLRGPGPTSTAHGKPIENVRVVLNRPAGRGVEFMLPITSGVLDNSWRMLSIPVSMIPGVTAENARFNEVRLFGDNSGVMYIGRIGVVVDASPLKLEPVSDKDVSTKNRYRYVASANAGITPLKYSWDWDDKDGIQEESIGRIVDHSYYKEGDYTGTVTVSDVYGIKAPISTRFKIHAHL